MLATWKSMNTSSFQFSWEVFWWSMTIIWREINVILNMNMFYMMNITHVCHVMMKISSLCLVIQCRKTNITLAMVCSKKLWDVSGNVCNQAFFSGNHILMLVRRLYLLKWYGRGVGWGKLVPSIDWCLTKENIDFHFSLVGVGPPSEVKNWNKETMFLNDSDTWSAPPEI